MRLRRLCGFVCVLLCGGPLAACGGGDATSGERTTTTPVAQGQPGAREPLAIPSQVPLRESGPGDPAAIKVIRLWSEALRRSDVEAASSYWAVPSKVQNGTPVLTLTTTTDVRDFNGSLSCGSILVSALGARNGFTIAVFKLTRRPGADCATGAGQHARTAILVRDGRIAEWYRLPDDPGAPAQPAAPQKPDGPVV